MRAKGVIIAAALGAVVAGQAAAADSSDDSTEVRGIEVQARRPTEVRGIVVEGRLPHEVRGIVVNPGRVCLEARKPPDPDVPPPKLVSSFPAKGAVVKPGIIVFRLTFDLPMACPGFLDADFPILDPCPAPLMDPVISKDRRTFMTICVVGPHLKYGLWLNRSEEDGVWPSRNPAQRWTSLAGHLLAPHEINFSTSKDAPVGTVEAAIDEDPFLRTIVGPAPDLAASPAPPVDVAPVTVTAPVKASDLARSRSFIEAYAEPTAKLDRYARWSDPPCVIVAGLAAEQAAAIKARVEDVARSAGLRPGGDGCRPNVEVEFTPQPQALVDQIVQKTPQVLGFKPASDAKALKTVSRPIQAWYMTASRGGTNALARGVALDVVPRLDLGAPNPGTTTSARLPSPNAASWAETNSAEQRDGRAQPTPNAVLSTPETLDGPGRGSAAGCAPQGSTCESVFRNVLVVIDTDRVKDQSVRSLTDYVALLALSQPRSLDGCMALASIVDVLAPAPCPGRDPPERLTSADQAYLAALYASDPRANAAVQQSEMSTHMAAALVKGPEVAAAR